MKSLTFDPGLRYVNVDMQGLFDRHYLYRSLEITILSCYNFVLIVPTILYDIALCRSPSREVIETVCFRTQNTLHVSMSSI